VREGRLRAVVASLALAGAGVAAYLVYARYTGTQLACSTGGCETVQHSRYAVVAGVPVAVIGLVGYVALLGTATVRGAAAAALGVGFAAIALLFSAYLLVAQVALIHAICQWCVTSDAIVTLISVAALWRYAVCLRETPQAVSAAPPIRGRRDRRETRSA
jgi:uncharacterized membrane protein